MKNMNLRTRLKKFRKREESPEVVSFIQNKKEKWYSFGDKSKFHTVYELKFQSKPLNFLKNIKTKKPNIMILGAGEGKDIELLNKFCENINKKPNIDVFSLTKSLATNIKKMINKDYSTNKALETLDQKKDMKLINEIKNKYDLVMAPLSVGVYTQHPVYNLFLSSLMLKKEGKLYIQLRTVKNIEKRFNKFVEIFNKNNKTKYKFEIKLIMEKEYTNKIFKSNKFYESYKFYEIKRIN